MNKYLLIGLLLLTTDVMSQDTLFTENFETASQHFTLNTSSASSNTTTYNPWVINNGYNGGSGSLTCFGFPFTFTVPSTPSQPASFANAPNSNYLHILSNEAFQDGINNSCFQTADGICYLAENSFAEMTTDINTSTYDSVALNFWWLCQGSANNYGEVYFSTNGGSTWLPAITPLSKYFNQSTWTSITVTHPAWAHQNTLRFGFRFVNQSSLTAADPAFSIDEILVTGSIFTGIPQVNSAQHKIFDLTPNPATQNLIISLYNYTQNGPTVFRLIDIAGKEAYRSELHQQKSTINLEVLSSGYYIAEVMQGNSIARSIFIRK